MKIDKEEYDLYLEMNGLEDNMESLASFLIGSGAEAIFDKNSVDNIEEAKKIYTELGRKCRLWTAFSYPTKMTIDEFAEEIKNSLEPFAQNMKHLKNDKMWAEDWAETLAAWCEMEKGKFRLKIWVEKLNH
jgi:hypothetical protein